MISQIAGQNIANVAESEKPEEMKSCFGADIEPVLIAGDETERSLLSQKRVKGRSHVAFVFGSSPYCEGAGASSKSSSSRGISFSFCSTHSSNSSAKGKTYIYYKLHV